MSIRPSSASDVSRLLAELTSDDVLRRETAVARLAVIGSRAVSGLLALAGDARAPLSGRVAALRALEGLADPRSATLCLALVDEPDAADDLAEAAVGVLAALARGTGSRASTAFDRLAALALDRGARVERRLAAVTALDGFPERLLKPLHEALARDPASRLVARVVRRQSGVLVPLAELVESPLPDDPMLVDAIVREDASDASPPVLRKLVDLIRRRERRATAATQPEWLAVRGQVHQALAQKQSRIALYDLRETLEDKTLMRSPLPVGFLAAAAAVGDTACLTPLAAAWVTSAGDDRWWRAHLAETFQAIAKREGITRQDPLARNILSRWPSAGTLVAMLKK
jgi:hypothetical protein